MKRKSKPVPLVIRREANRRVTEAIARLDFPPNGRAARRLRTALVPLVILDIMRRP